CDAEEHENDSHQDAAVPHALSPSDGCGRPERSASGLFRSRRLLQPIDPRWLLGSLRFLGLCQLSLRELRGLGVAALEAPHDLSQILLRQQALGLHRLEDLAPTLVTLSELRDLLLGQRLGALGLVARLDNLLSSR